MSEQTGEQEPFDDDMVELLNAEINTLNEQLDSYRRQISNADQTISTNKNRLTYLEREIIQMKGGIEANENNIQVYQRKIAAINKRKNELYQQQAKLERYDDQ